MSEYPRVNEASLSKFHQGLKIRFPTTGRMYSCILVLKMNPPKKRAWHVGGVHVYANEQERHFLGAESIHSYERLISQPNQIARYKNNQIESFCF
jgi:hypothetical protein